MLPTLAIIKNEKTTDYVVGLDELGGVEDFSTGGGRWGRGQGVCGTRGHSQGWCLPRGKARGRITVPFGWGFCQAGASNLACRERRVLYAG